MALQFSSNFLGFRAAQFDTSVGFDLPTLVLVKNTVPFPQIQSNGNFITYNSDGSVYQSGTTVPVAQTADRIITMTVSGNSTGNTYFISGTLSATIANAGTIGWFYLVDSTASPSATLISNSVGLSGSGAVLTVNSLSFSSGATCTVSLNLRFLRS